VWQNGADPRATEEVHAKVMAGQAERTRTNVVYLPQTHTRPAQVARLVSCSTAWCYLSHVAGMSEPTPNALPPRRPCGFMAGR
jgi:hypothetical protein